jgi:hypothetical protein
MAQYRSVETPGGRVCTSAGAARRQFTEPVHLTSPLNNCRRGQNAAACLYRLHRAAVTSTYGSGVRLCREPRYLAATNSTHQGKGRP